MSMEWLWLFLAVVGLGLLWLLIIGMEKLTERLKANDEARRMANKEIAERTAEAEANFWQEKVAKDSAQDYIEHAEFNGQDDATLREAIDTLSSQELVQSVAKRMFGANNKSISEIEATRSVFDQNPVRKVIAKGEGITPVKVKSSSKSQLSKSEQKMLKKIKQGD